MSILKKSLLLILIVISLMGCAKADLPNEDAAQIIRDEYLLILGNDDGDNVLTGALAQGFEIEVQKVTKNEDGYQVSCRVANYDISHIFSSLDATQIVSMEQYNTMVEKAITDSDKMISDLIFLIQIDQDNSFKVEFTEEQLNLACGGLFTYISEVEK